jgi:hypothetical protein
VRCWRLADGATLVEVEAAYAPDYHELSGAQLIRSYYAQLSDAAEVLHISAYQVAGDRFEHCSIEEIGYPYSRRVRPGEVVHTGLVALPDGTITRGFLGAALAAGPRFEAPDPMPVAEPGAVFAEGSLIEAVYAAFAREAQSMRTLEGLVEDLYAAFAGVPAPARVTGCPHCRDGDADCELLRGPLAQLDAATLGPYLFAAITTWGTAGDFRYFAPRALELAVTGRLPYPDLEIVLGKFALAGWQRWPERAAVSALLEHWWGLALADHPGFSPAEDVLCTLAQAVDDLTPYLDLWRASLDSDAAAEHLRDFAYAASTEARTRGRLPNAFWRGRPDQQAAVAGWLLSAELGTAITAAFDRATDRAVPSPAAAALDLAYQYLQP